MSVAQENAWVWGREHFEAESFKSLCIGVLSGEGTAVAILWRKISAGQVEQVFAAEIVSQKIYFFFQLESVTSVFARKETCEPVFLTFVSSLKCLIRLNPNSPLTPAAQPHTSALCVDTK